MALIELFCHLGNSLVRLSLELRNLLLCQVLLLRESVVEHFGLISALLEHCLKISHLFAGLIFGRNHVLLDLASRKVNLLRHFGFFMLKQLLCLEDLHFVGHVCRLELLDHGHRREHLIARVFQVTLFFLELALKCLDFLSQCEGLVRRLILGQGLVFQGRLLSIVETRHLGFVHRWEVPLSG